MGHSYQLFVFEGPAKLALPPKFTTRMLRFGCLLRSFTNKVSQHFLSYMLVKLLFIMVRTVVSVSSPLVGWQRTFSPRRQTPVLPTGPSAGRDRVPLSWRSWGRRWWPCGPSRPGDGQTCETRRRSSDGQVYTEHTLSISLWRQGQMGWRWERSTDKRKVPSLIHGQTRRRVVGSVVYVIMTAFWVWVRIPRKVYNFICVHPKISPFVQTFFIHAVKDRHIPIIETSRKRGAVTYRT